jgi:vacuolar-type H+-ATPase subunit E/Vma4
MALEEILEKIDRDTSEEEKAIIDKGRDQAKKIIEDAKARVQSTIDAYQKSARDDAKIMRMQETSSATLNGRYALEKAIEEIEGKYVDALKSRINELRGTTKYYDFLEKRIENAWKQLGPGSIVYLDSKDIQKMKERGLPLTFLTKDIDPLGGAIVTSADGKMIIDLTFSEILRKKRDDIVKIVRDFIG